MKEPSHELALNCIEAAIRASSPENATQENVDLDGDILSVGNASYDLTQYEKIVLIGGGKASGGVSRVLEEILGGRLSDSLVVTNQQIDTEIVRTVIGTHPLPSFQNIEATETILNRLSDAGEETLILFVLTGGASALLTAPAEELQLEDIRQATDRLLEGGVPITDINIVRKHLSASKGGQFARKAAPATVVGLLLSDVVGNDLSTIGSGPSAPDETTFDDALEVFKRHDVEAPDTVRTHLGKGIHGEFPETPSPDSSLFDQIENHVIGDNQLALKGAQAVAEEAGYRPVILSSHLQGEAQTAAKRVISVAEVVKQKNDSNSDSIVLLCGGESTVSVTNSGGMGGPNQEFALSTALELENDIVVAAVDTDGEDGSSDVAGAIVDKETVTNRTRAKEFLEKHDAGTYLDEVGATIQTGPTGTNVNDVIVVVIPE